jgi:hypothetical protein
MDPSDRGPRNRAERRAHHGTTEEPLSKPGLRSLFDPRTSRLGRTDLRIWMITRMVVLTLLVLLVLGVLGKLS